VRSDTASENAGSRVIGRETLAVLLVGGLIVVKVGIGARVVEEGKAAAAVLRTQELIMQGKQEHRLLCRGASSCFAPYWPYAPLWATARRVELVEILALHVVDILKSLVQK